jgi:hypothetical protein
MIDKFECRPGFVLDEHKLEQAGGIADIDATEFFVEAMLASKGIFNESEDPCPPPASSGRRGQETTGD